MLDQKDCHIELIPHKMDRFHQLFRLVRVHACRRLVEQQQLWIRCKCTRNLKLSLLSVWKIGGQETRLALQIKHF